jgi:hypothetical protein
VRAVPELGEVDLAAGRGRVPLPFALARKYPNADRGRWVFAARSHDTDRRSGAP